MTGWRRSKLKIIPLLAALTLFVVGSLVVGSQDARAAIRHKRPHRASLHPPVINLDYCRPSADCDYGPIYETYPPYGNAYPADLGDCTFAAAAHWEQIVLRIVPDATLLGYEFAGAAGAEGAEAGLTQEQFFTYWQQRGIAGVLAKRFDRHPTTPSSTRDGVRAYGALIAELSFAEDAAFAQYWVSAGLHEVVVDGFTPKGPLVVSWGHTLQMSWAQWHAEAIGMWAVEAAR